MAVSCRIPGSCLHLTCVNPDGKVSKAEFVNAGGDGHEFDLYDRDGDGKLTHGELQHRAAQHERVGSPIILQSMHQDPTDELHAADQSAGVGVDEWRQEETLSTRLTAAATATG